MLTLTIANSKKTGNPYCAVTAVFNGKTTYLTFDKQTIVRMLDITYGALEALPVGVYKINEKGEIER